MKLRGALLHPTAAAPPTVAAPVEAMPLPRPAEQRPFLRQSWTPIPNRRGQDALLDAALELEPVPTRNPRASGVLAQGSVLDLLDDAD